MGSPLDQTICFPLQVVDLRASRRRGFWARRSDRCSGQPMPVGCRGQMRRPVKFDEATASQANLPGALPKGINYPLSLPGERKMRWPSIVALLARGIAEVPRSNGGTPKSTETAEWETAAA